VEVEHAMDLLATGHRTGYLLKSRVTDVAEFIETLKRVVRGGSAVDPALVQEQALWVTEGTVEKHVRSINDEAQSARDRRGPPPGARGARLSGNALTGVRLANDSC